MRTMARRPDGSDQALAELKGVDAAYPLVGAVEVAGGAPLQEVLRDGAVVDPALLERLKLKVGDEIGLGAEKVKIDGVLKSEPDGITDRLTYGPRILISQATLDKAGLIKPGTLVRWRYAVKTSDVAASDGRSRVAAAQDRSGAPGSRLHDRRPARSLPAGEPHAGAAAAVPHPHRVDGAAGRRRRHRQCGGDVHRQAPQGDRYDEEHRCNQPHGARHFPRRGSGRGGDGCRARSRARYAGAARARRAVRRHAAHPGGDDGDAAERRHGARLRVWGRAAVHAVAARARRTHQRQHAVPRRGGAGAHAAAHVGDRRDACCRRWRSSPSRC